MSSNKGKDGEMQVIRVLCDISESTDGCDFIRPTITNDSDGGSDLVLNHPSGFLNTLSLIAEGADIDSLPELLPGRTEKSRIDVKKTDKKNSKATATNFVGQIKLNPECKGHILMGGNGLTKGAKRVIDEALEELEGTDKKIIYIPNEGVKRIANHFQNKLCDSDRENSE